MNGAERGNVILKSAASLSGGKIVAAEFVDNAVFWKKFVLRRFRSSPYTQREDALESRRPINLTRRAFPAFNNHSCPGFGDSVA